MGGNFDAVRFGHGGNFEAFQDPTGLAGVRLGNVQGLAVEEVFEFIAHAGTFAPGNGDGGVLAHVGVAFVVCGEAGFFQPEEVVGFQGFCCADGFRRGPGCRVVAHDGVCHQFDIWTEDFPAGCNAFFVVFPVDPNAHFDGFVSTGEVITHFCFEFVEGLLQASAGVDGKFFVAEATQEAVYGLSGGFPGNVPEGIFDGAGNGYSQAGATPVEVAAVHGFKAACYITRISAFEEAAEEAEEFGRGFSGHKPTAVHVAQAGEAFVGVDPDEGTVDEPGFPAGPAERILFG